MTIPTLIIYSNLIIMFTPREISNYLNVEILSKKELLKKYFAMKSVQKKYGKQLADCYDNLIELSREDFDFALLMLKANRFELQIYSAEILRRQTLVN